MSDIKPRGFKEILVSQEGLYLIAISWIVVIIALIWNRIDPFAFPPMAIGVIGAATGFCLFQLRSTFKMQIAGSSTTNEDSVEKPSDMNGE